MTDFNFPQSVASAVSNLDSIVDFERKNTVKFGINFLDDVFGGLSPKDLMLIGAASGVGKTQLSMSIAAEAARMGRKVMMYALEAEKDEMMMRMLYRKFANWYFKQEMFARDYISFDKFMRGEPEKYFDMFKRSTENSLDEFATMHVQYFDDTITVEDFEKRLIEASAMGCQMIVIDHLHYFDLMSENENQEIKRIVKLIRSFVLDKMIPVILVSHVRKKNEITAKLTPTADDFHGSSDIVKIATKAITIAPLDGIQIGTLTQKKTEAGKTITEFNPIKIPMNGGTFIRAVKNRRNGSVTAYTMFCRYDNRTSGYAENYFIGRPCFANGRVAMETFEDQAMIPHWAVNVIRE